MFKDTKAAAKCRKEKIANNITNKSGRLLGGDKAKCAV